MAERDIKVGIRNIGIYLPKFRLSGKVLSEAWRRPMGRGVKTVPNFDEDSLTMAVGAVINTLGDSVPGALYFATTSAPYLEKSSAGVIAAAADLPESARTMDIGGSLRAGTAALITGIECISAGRTDSVIVAASDCRFAEPGSDLESVTGAGAAALELTANDMDKAFEIIEYGSTTGDITDFWRKAGDRYIHHSDMKYASTYGSSRTVIDSVRRFLEVAGKNIAEFNSVVISVPDARSARGIAGKLSVNPEQLQDNLAGHIGLTGCAHGFIMLADAAARCPVGEEILMANYGDGCDIVIIKKLKELPSTSLKNGIANILSDSKELESYTKFMSYHDLVKHSSQNLTTTPFSSTILSYREETLNIRNHGRKCKNCGSIQTMQFNVCMHCNAKEQFTDFKLAKRGKINTFTQEYYYTTPEPPVTMAVVDLDGGGRITVQMTDTEPDRVEIDMPVELTFRKLHQGAGFINYCWKCRRASQDAPSTGGDVK